MFTTGTGADDVLADGLINSFLSSKDLAEPLQVDHTSVEALRCGACVFL